jgi:hypothetical protein
LAGTRNSVEVHLIARDFSGHEGLIGIEALRRDTALPINVPLTQLASRSDNEVRNVFLRFHSLVEVIVSIEHYTYVLFHEERFEHFTEA